ncbi:MAG TPA: hypothetical protein VK684_01185 [Edaphobacter sp.]|jgi:hypothetical protein|nr:hypothetical protein [Edaphobacter sp.]
MMIATHERMPEAKASCVLQVFRRLKPCTPSQIAQRYLSKSKAVIFAAFEAAHLSMLDFFSDLLQPISCRI